MVGVVIPVRTDGDVGHVRREVRRIALGTGLNDQAVAEAATAATELATNLVRHRTVDGEITVSDCNSDITVGIEISSRDRGPGIADLQAALNDHWSSQGSTGCGLGAVRRLMDEFEIRSCVANGQTGDETLDVGTSITVRKWTRRDCTTARFVYSANSRPYIGEKSNGDGYFVYEDQAGLLVAVADGLGHGPEAARASDAAMEHIRANRKKNPEDLIRDLHQVLRGTRGAAATLVWVSVPERRLIHVGVGNVAARVYPVGGSQLMTRPGVLGMGSLPKLRVNESVWPEGGTLLIYTDGITGQWDLREQSPDDVESPTSIGHYLMRNFAKSNDDATVVVATETL